MALLFFDGFETYGPSVSSFDEMRDVYSHDDDSDLSGALITVESSNRILNGQLLEIDHNVPDTDLSTVRTMRLPLAGLTSQDTLIVGAAVRAPSGFTSGYTTIFEFYSVLGESMVNFRVVNGVDLHLDFMNTPAATVNLDTASSALSGTDWHFIEIKITFHGSGGDYEVRVDGSSVMSDTGVKTNNSSNDQPAVIVFGHIEARKWQYDDFYVMDDTGGAPTNDFLGEVFVQRVRPNAVGDSSQLTASPGAGANYEDVVEDAEDGDSSYVESKTATQKDLYNFEDIDPLRVGTIFGVVAKPVIRKTDAGSRTYRLLAKSGSTEVNSGTRYPSVTYIRQTYIWTTDPDTGTAWTATGFNAAQFGLEIVA